jgi:hypothetical protein
MNCHENCARIESLKNCANCALSYETICATYCLLNYDGKKNHPDRKYTSASMKCDKWEEIK